MAKGESCCNCVYAKWSAGQWVASVPSVFPPRPTCANQPDLLGRMKDCPYGRVCVNFRARPPTPQGETVVTIALGDGFYAYVDAADYEWLSRWNWHLDNGYAIRHEKGKTIYMHREIVKAPKGMIVDHKNRNKLDNTPDNLRVGTRQENRRNAGKRIGATSRFKGVSRKKKGRDIWAAYIGIDRDTKGLGTYYDEIEAARAYDRAAVEHFGEFARLNFPEEWPEERRAQVYQQRDAAQKPVGATHASPVQAKAKTSRAKRTTKSSRVTGHGSRGTAAKAKGKTSRGKRATKSSRVTGRGSRSTKKAARAEARGRRGRKSAAASRRDAKRKRRASGGTNAKRRRRGKTRS